MAQDYKQYQTDVTADIAGVIAKHECQPILFIGSGFSARYASAPNWEALLRELASACPLIDRDVAYYRQSGMSLPQVGTEYAKAYKEWAWGKGRKQFPEHYFDAQYPSDVFLKYAVSLRLSALGPSKKGSYGSPELDAEIEALKQINPHAIITTNYDELLAPMFSDYERVIGQQVIRQSYLSIGEIFKIHGCVSDPLSLTLTAEDYQKFETDKKYLSAKLLTYFVEHPLLFVGYSASDENIRAILEEIDHMLPEQADVIPNIYILEWDNTINAESNPPREKLIAVSGGRSIRLKSIVASSYEWVFKAFCSDKPLEKI
ncbi:SIR2 family protein [Noviherbaspirillum aridicola]|uniref:SIR2-like protein n=1 Tax=Noviherbaspirillum aridicola TaxID=2849687 RepID=A0ABQ4QAL7_9BURK|nr:SIR2 family protein [Noviherbaspirillum aridicola]GIZ54114.1 hypothetical protein NCCP691_41280 [Noviherbaspirillum aridicola]